MKILTALVLVVLLCLAPMASAITISDTTAIQNSCKSFVDNGLVKKIVVTVMPPDGVRYNITANFTVDSASAIATARSIGVIAFSNLTYYHPEVTKGVIGIFLDGVVSGSKSAFFDIYSSDLSLITDRRNLSQSEALKLVNNIISKRGTRTTVAVLKPTPSSSYVIPTPSSSYVAPKQTTSSSSSSSSRCDQVVHVKGYTTKKGKYVAPYDRRPPGCG